MRGFGPLLTLLRQPGNIFHQKHFFNLIYWFFFLFVAGVGVLVGGRPSTFRTRPRVPSFPDTCSPGTALTKQALDLDQTSTCEPDPVFVGVVERWGGGHWHMEDRDVDISFSA